MKTLKFYRIPDGNRLLRKYHCRRGDRFCTTVTARDRKQNRFPDLARFLVQLHTLETYRWRWVVGLADALVYDQFISASIAVRWAARDIDGESTSKILMKRYPRFYLAIASLILVACTRSQPAQQPTPQLKVVTLNDTFKTAIGQTVYVPVYSHIYSEDRTQKIDLAVTLSIRNTDLTHPIIIVAVNYYNTSGALVRKYLEQPVELGALVSTDFVVDRDDTSGGVGANFIVEWVAQKQVSDPAIEAVMINTRGNQGLSFVSQGRVIKSRGLNRNITRQSPNSATEQQLPKKIPESVPR